MIEYVLDVYPCLRVLVEHLCHQIDSFSGARVEEENLTSLVYDLLLDVFSGYTFEGELPIEHGEHHHASTPDITFLRVSGDFTLELPDGITDLDSSFLVFCGSSLFTLFQKTLQLLDIPVLVATPDDLGCHVGGCATAVAHHLLSGSFGKCFADTQVAYLDLPKVVKQYVL